MEKELAEIKTDLLLFLRKFLLDRMQGYSKELEAGGRFPGDQDEMFRVSKLREQPDLLQPDLSKKGLAKAQHALEVLDKISGGYCTWNGEDCVFLLWSPGCKLPDIFSFKEKQYKL